MLDTAGKLKAEIILCQLQLKALMRIQKWVFEDAKYAFQITSYY